jgi:HlyD family secretion protein
LIFAAALMAVAGSGAPPTSSDRRVAGLPSAVVRRTDLEVTFGGGGNVGSSKFTMVSCEAEHLGDGAGAMTILSLVPEGTLVKKGDVLCRLDSSDYEELVRQQEIELERSTSEKAQAELDLKAAEEALREYRDGQAVQSELELRGKVTLAEADRSKAKNRLAWVRKMLARKYVSAAEVTAQEDAWLRTEVALAQANSDYRHFRLFTRPKVTLELEAKIAGFREKLAYSTMCVRSNRERLEHLKKQVELCTIHAPHDGFVVHCELAWFEDPKVREGIQVYQGQPLCSLPDLAGLNVEMSVHESIVDRIRPGMPARIRVGSRPDRILAGHVESIDPLPRRNWRVGLDVFHFMAKVKIDEVVPGVLPLMSADVEVVTDRRPNALVVPAEAVTYEDDRPLCYVAGPTGLRRRPIRVGKAGRDLVEVLGGLAEGEEVILRPREALRKLAEGA